MVPVADVLASSVGVGVLLLNELLDDRGVLPTPAGVHHALERVQQTIALHGGGARAARLVEIGLQVFDPKDGRTIQHALIINGTISVFSDKGPYRSVKSVDNIPEMIIATITQGVKKSKIQFDSDDLRQEVFNAFVNKFLDELLGYSQARLLRFT